MRTVSVLVLSTAALSSSLVACGSAGTSAAAADAAVDGTSGAIDAASSADSSSDADGASSLESGSSEAGASDGARLDGDAAGPAQALVTSIDPGVAPIAVTINQGTAIGQGALNGATPSTLANVAADPNNVQTMNSGTDPFSVTGIVPDTAAGFCDYFERTPTRASYVTGSKFETAGADGGPGTDPMVPVAPFYFPLVYWTTNTTDGQRLRWQATHHRPLRLAAQGHRRGASSRPSPTTTDVPGTSCRRCSSSSRTPRTRSAAVIRRRPRTQAARRPSPTRTRAPPRRMGRRPTTAGGTRRSSSSLAQATSRRDSFSTCWTGT